MDDCAAGSIRWGSPTSLTFELQTSHAEVLQHAARVFRPWLHLAGRTVDRCWRIERTGVERAHHDSGWRVTSDGGSDADRAYTTIGDALLAVEYSAISELLGTPQRLADLHAALLVRRGCGLILVGRSESGKSTLACALWQAGWSFLCDDGVLLDTRGLRAFPAPRRVSLRESSRGLLGAELWHRVLRTPACDKSTKGHVFHPDEVDGHTRPGSAPLSAIVFLGHRDCQAGPAEVRPVDSARCLFHLIPHSLRARRLETGQAISLFAPLADAVPAFEIGRGPLAEMVHQVQERAVGHLAGVQELAPCRNWARAA